MTIANPIGWIGLLSLPAIVLLHLLYERRRRFVVSHLPLWAFLDVEPASPRRRRIPLTWLLFLDLLIAALISLAWAQPVLDLPLPQSGPRHLVLVIDVSTSMRAVDGSASRLDQARNRALSLLDDLGRGSVATVLSFGNRARLVGDSRQEDMASLRARLSALRGGETGHALPEALALARAALEADLPGEIHVLTDGAFPADGPLAASAGREPAVYWHWFGEAVPPGGNQAVLDLRVAPVGGLPGPGQGQLQVFARLANFSDQAVSRRWTLEVGGAPADQGQVDLPANAAVPYVWQVTAPQVTSEGAADPPSVAVSLQGGDSLAEDDIAIVALRPDGRLRIVLVAEDPAPLQRAVRAALGGGAGQPADDPSSPVDLQAILPQDYPAWLAEGQPPADLTIYRNYLPPAWPGGPVLIVEPPFAGEVDLAQSLAPGAAALLAQSRREALPGAALLTPHPDPLVAGLRPADFSGVRWERVRALNSLPPGFLPLLQVGELPLLLRGAVQQAPASPEWVAVLLADLEQGNFTRHPAFPILIAALVENARPSPLPPAFHTGQAIRLPAPTAGQALRVVTPAGETLEVDSSGPAGWDQALDPGLYRFQLAGAGPAPREYAAGVNAGEAAESDLRRQDWTRSVAGEGSPANPGVGQGAPPAGVDLRPWLLTAALLALFGEVWLAWRR